MNGKLWVDEFVTHHQSLDNINKGFDDMHVSASSACGVFTDAQAGDCIRCVVNMGFPASDEE